MNTKNVYFVPFGQDSPESKPNSLVAHLELLVPTVAAALAGRQLQPVLVSWSEEAVRGTMLRRHSRACLPEAGAVGL